MNLLKCLNEIIEDYRNSEFIFAWNYLNVFFGRLKQSIEKAAILCSQPYVTWKYANNFFNYVLEKRNLFIKGIASTN
jgi:hypothetical protein